jgi:hypothetical protein
MSSINMMIDKISNYRSTIFRKWVGCLCSLKEFSNELLNDFDAYHPHICRGFLGRHFIFYAQLCITSGHCHWSGRSKVYAAIGFSNQIYHGDDGRGYLTVLSGLVMYWQIFNFRLSALSSGYGLMLTLGAIAGFIGLLTGYFLQNRITVKMKALSESIAAAGGPPTPEQQTEMKSLSETVTRGGQISSVSLALALLGMSVAQYVFF